LKTQIADWLFLYNVIYNNLEKENSPKVKIFYFTLEMSKEEKLRKAISNLLYIKEGVRIAPKDLRSTHQNRMLDDKTLELIKKNSEFIKKIEETVEFIDNISTATGIYKFMELHARENGIQHKRIIKLNGQEVEVDDYYEPNDPELYVMVMVDHIGLLAVEQNEDGRILNLHQCISKLSSTYLIKLKKKNKYIPVIVKQQAEAQESADNIK